MDSLWTVFFIGEKPAKELYDLQQGPYEIQNLISNPEYRVTLENLRRMLDQWEHQLPALK